MSFWKSTGIVACLATALSLSTAASAQTAPPADGPKQGPPPSDRPEGGPPPRDGQDGPPPRDGQDGPGGQGDRGQRPPRPDQGGPDANRPQGQSGTSDVMRYQGFLNMVSQYSKLTSDPESAGVAAVVSASDVLRRGGPQEAISYFTKLLPEVKIEAVRRAIRLQLVDLYKVTKQDDKALEQLKVLITAETAEFPSTKK